MKTPEHERLEQARTGASAWKAWGPYLSERQWGTVREDYSAGGDAWNYFPHEHARSRAYRWGEDGIAGICDERQRLCLALALWNGADPILKERMFGLTNSEGNHGEDVKEYWFYLDSTPTHSYMKCLYKYPQAAFPYNDLVATNARRGKLDMEYELLDTGVFNDDRYFDVVVEYAKAAPDDVLMLVTAHNRGPDEAPLHLLPTLWFRNTWSWGDGHAEARPRRRAGRRRHRHPRAARRTRRLADVRRRLRGAVVLRERDEHRADVRHPQRLSVRQGRDQQPRRARRRGRRQPGAYRHQGGRPARAHGPRRRQRLDPDPPRGPAAAPTPAATPPTAAAMLGSGFDEIFATRRSEADAFYAKVIPPSLRDDGSLVMRQALAGLLWGKQYYEYDVHRWLIEHGQSPWNPDAPASSVRNVAWFHMVAQDIISMPDKWEYPWFAAWDLAFHCAPLSLVDVDFAKQQVELLLKTRYHHPNGQIPAYEWNFSDVNPPVTAWAALYVYEREAEIRGAGRS